MIIKKQNNEMVRRGDRFYKVGEYSEALKCYRNAMDNDCALASARIGIMIERGEHVVCDIGDAETYYRLSAKSGSPFGMYLLGRLLFVSGHSYGRNEGVLLIKKSAKLNFPPALYTLGTMYEHGEGVPQDKNAADHCFKSAADLGHVYAKGVIARREIFSYYGLKNIPLGIWNLLSVIFYTLIEMPKAIIEFDERFKK